MKRLASNRTRARALVLAAALAALGACTGPHTVAVQPAEITRDTACSLDGMTLMDYPGPKAQIVYERGEPDFFCDTIELFSSILKPEQARPVRGVYVQDMGQADWNNPTGHWIDAKSAFYVVGSKRRGSMGPTIASYARETDARELVAKEGGRVVRFEQVTPDMAVLDGGVLKDRAEQHS
jgi:copper chaperone NosL